MDRTQKTIWWKSSIWPNTSENILYNNVRNKIAKEIKESPELTLFIKSKAMIQFASLLSEKAVYYTLLLHKLFFFINFHFCYLLCMSLIALIWAGKMWDAVTKKCDKFLPPWEMCLVWSSLVVWNLNVVLKRLFLSVW